VALRLPILRVRFGLWAVAAWGWGGRGTDEVVFDPNGDEVGGFLGGGFGVVDSVEVGAGVEG